MAIHAGAVMLYSTDPRDRLDTACTVTELWPARMSTFVPAACRACTRRESRSQVWTSTSPARFSIASRAPRATGTVWSVLGVRACRCSSSAGVPQGQKPVRLFQSINQSPEERGRASATVHAGCQSARVPRCQGAKVPECQSAKVPKCRSADVPCKCCKCRRAEGAERASGFRRCAYWASQCLARSLAALGALAPWHPGTLAPCTWPLPYPPASALARRSSESLRCRASARCRFR